MWKQLSDYCWTNVDFNICKVGSALGETYELWDAKTKEQLAVNLESSRAAIDECRRIVAQREKSPKVETDTQPSLF